MTYRWQGNSVASEYLPRGVEYQSQELCLPTAVASWRGTATGVRLPGFECLFSHLLLMSSEPQFSQLDNGLHNTYLMVW